MIYIFDGTLEGLLTAVFEWFERKPGPAILKSKEIHQPDAFMPSFEVLTDREKADRVWKGMTKKLDRAWMRRAYCSYLSELPQIHHDLFQFIIYIFQSPNGAEQNYGHPQVLSITQILSLIVYITRRRLLGDILESLALSFRACSSRI